MTQQDSLRENSGFCSQTPGVKSRSPQPGSPPTTAKRADGLHHLTLDESMTGLGAPRGSLSASFNMSAGSCLSSPSYATITNAYEQQVNNMQMKYALMIEDTLNESSDTAEQISAQIPHTYDIIKVNNKGCDTLENSTGTATATVLS